MVVPSLMIAAAVAVLIGIAVVSTGYGGELASAGPTRPGFKLPVDRALAPAELEQVRFSAGFWGYPPAQVEEVLDHAVRALAERDAHIAHLEHRLLAGQLGGNTGGSTGGSGAGGGASSANGGTHRDADGSQAESPDSGEGSP